MTGKYMWIDRILPTNREFLQLITGFVLCVASVGTVVAADLFNGQKIYNMHCQACHGVDGISVHALAPDFQRGERLMTPDLELLNSIKSGKGAMPAFEGLVREKEILDVIAYIRTLAR